jgi:putative ABC transport system permease protein
MRVPLLRGRLFTEADRAGAPLAVLINQALARSYFRDEDPIGQRVAFDRVPDSTSHWRTIVGVVGDERQEGVAAESRPEFVAPYQQEPRNAMTLVVRTAADPAALGPAIRRIVKELDPDLAITSIRPMTDVLGAAVARDRFLTTLFLAFAGVGAALAVVGVYGVVAQLVRGRMREMGIRIALGARDREVQWLVLRRGLMLTAAGVSVGVAAGLAASRLMRALLYQVGPADLATFVTVPALLLRGGGSGLAAGVARQRGSAGGGAARPVTDEPLIP